MKSLVILTAAAALAAGRCLAADKPEKPSKSEVEAVVPAPLTDEAKTALAAIDARMVGVEEIAKKVDDPDYKKEVGDQIADLKKRRLALEKNYDQGLSEALMHSVISRYQIIALWLKPPALPPPPGFKVPPPRPKSEKKGDNAPGNY
jgi:hypothetical protein